MLYRIFQDALSNIERHAKARHVTVGLTKEGGCVLLVVGDDGTGFVVSRQRSVPGASEVGLTAMRERAAYVGGKLTISSNRQSGTRITVRIPLLAATPAAA